MNQIKCRHFDVFEAIHKATVAGITSVLNGSLRSVT